MARNVTLTKLLDDLRAEARLSLNPAHNADARQAQVKLLQRHQDRLWEDFDWGHLKVQRDIPAQAGQRYYDTPADIPLDRITKIEFFTDGCWHPIKHGIDSGHYAAWNSDLPDQRSWPIRRWKIHEDEDIELWPLADRNGNETTFEGMIRFHGIRKLRPLVDEQDRCDLDSHMLVLFGAAELLAATGAKDAKLKLDAANAFYNKLRKGMTPRKSFRMFGVGTPEPPRRLVIGSYRPPE